MQANPRCWGSTARKAGSARGGAPDKPAPRFARGRGCPPLADRGGGRDNATHRRRRAIRQLMWRPPPRPHFQIVLIPRARAAPSAGLHYGTAPPRATVVHARRSEGRSRTWRNLLVGRIINGQPYRELSATHPGTHSVLATRRLLGLCDMEPGRARRRAQVHASLLRCGGRYGSGRRFRRGRLRGPRCLFTA